MNGEQQSGLFKTIVLALDGSEGSRRGIPFARELARQGGGRVVIAHVREQAVTKGGGAPPHEDEIQASIDREAEEISQQGIETNVETGTVVLGGPAHAINEIADGAGADLIITGTRGHSPVSGLLLGSVTLRLLHIAKCPVLAVPPGVTPERL
jgi:nucleotide-binding universal stress UspA family protein